MRDGITARESYEREKLTKISHGKIYRGKIKRNVMVVHANFRNFWNIERIYQAECEDKMLFWNYDSFSKNSNTIHIYIYVGMSEK